MMTTRTIQRTIALALFLALSSTAPAIAKTHTKGSTKASHQAPTKTHQPTQSSSKKSTKAARAKDGRIQRSDAARHAFARKTGYPNGRPGYVIDHIVPLACGGADTPANMQWQTVDEAKAKDRWERKGCQS